MFTPTNLLFHAVHFTSLHPLLPQRHTQPNDSPPLPPSAISVHHIVHARISIHGCCGPRNYQIHSLLPSVTRRRARPHLHPHTLDRSVIVSPSRLPPNTLETTKHPECLRSTTIQHRHRPHTQVKHRRAHPQSSSLHKPPPDTRHPPPDTRHQTPDTRQQTTDTRHPTPDTRQQTPDTLYSTHVSNLST
jgi:hypothetical protein